MRGVGDNCARANDDGCIDIDPAYFNHRQLSLLDIGPVLQLPDNFGQGFSGDIEDMKMRELFNQLLWDLPDHQFHPMRYS